MARLQITGNTYINPHQIVSVDLETRSQTYIENEYRDNAKFHKINSYLIIIKMSNGDTYTETYSDKEKARERRDNLITHWN